MRGLTGTRQYANASNRHDRLCHERCEQSINVNHFVTMNLLLLQDLCHPHVEGFSGRSRPTLVCNLVLCPSVSFVTCFRGKRERDPAHGPGVGSGPLPRLPPPTCSRPVGGVGLGPCCYAASLLRSPGPARPQFFALRFVTVCHLTYLSLF